MVCLTLFEQTERMMTLVPCLIVDTSHMHLLNASVFNNNGLFQEHILKTPLPKLRIM